MCGGTRRVGTCSGLWKNVGSSMVTVGMMRIRLVMCGWKNGA